MKKRSLLSLFCFQTILILGLLSSMPAYAEDVTPMVAVGNSHTVALKADGTVWSWGQGGDGEMGNGNTYDYSSPLLSPAQANITDVKYVAVGNSCTYAIKNDGTLWSWGFNGNGELGLGDKIDRNVPTQVPGLSDIIQVAGTNGAFAACLKADGTVYAWGTNGAGQLGNGTTTASTVPVPATAAGFTDIKEIDVAGNHVVARKGDGTVWTWGLNSRKQCGRAGQSNYKTPGQVDAAGVENIVKVRAGGTHTVVLKEGGTVWTWGNNGSGQLGKGYDIDDEYLKSLTSPWAVYDPAQVAGLTGITDINAGSAHTVVKKSDGSVWSVGMNFRGEFGDGNCLANSLPYASAEFRQALITGSLMQIESFEYNTAFLKADGSVWTCGANSTGQIGNGATSLYIDIPSKVPGLNLIADETLAGDVDGSGSVGLSDAIAVLRMVSGTSQGSGVRRRADVNSDGQIGLAEAVFVLQSVAGTRECIGAGCALPQHALYVDGANSGAQDGTAEHPYATIEAAIAAAEAGTVVHIAAGTYTPADGTLYMKAGVSLEGISAARTIIDGDLQDRSTGVLPVSLSKLTFHDYLFGRGSPVMDPTGTNEIKDCSFHSLNVAYGGRASESDKLFQFRVENNRVSGSLEFNHGKGAATNTVLSNTVSEGIYLQMGAGATNTVRGNAVTIEIANRSGACTTSISHNTVTGQIVDKSGCKVDNIIENNTVTYNGGSSGEYKQNAGIVAKSAGVTIRNNTVVCTVVSSGIIAMSGETTDIIGNSVTVPYAADATDPDNPICAIFTQAGAGAVTGNTLTGGFYGIFDMSGGRIEGNTVTGAHHGIYADGGKAYQDNSVTGCQGDGLIVMGAPGPYSGNTVSGNQGAGVRVADAQWGAGYAVADFGGGALSGTGGNTFTGNAAGDFLVESLASDVATIMVRYNHWDHTTAADIHGSDIYDGHDSGELSMVDIGP